MHEATKISKFLLGKVRLVLLIMLMPSPYYYGLLAYFPFDVSMLSQLCKTYHKHDHLKFTSSEKYLFTRSFYFVMN